MNRDRFLSMVAISLITFGGVAPISPVQAKRNWTVTERQVQLKKEVDGGQKSNELTLKEASALRDRLAGIQESEQKMKAKNGGKLSYKDEGKLEKKLNGISVDIQKEKLAKRTVVK